MLPDLIFWRRRRAPRGSERGPMSTLPRYPAPHVPTSWGELIDKITILEIKCERLEGETALTNARRELSLLREIAAPVLTDDAVKALAVRLKAVNETLWKIEDDIRSKEAAGQFDEEFITLARSVYKRNDERGALKRQINLVLQSELIEEKNYKPY
jgi:hypothetical protein